MPSPIFHGQGMQKARLVRINEQGLGQGLWGRRRALTGCPTLDGVQANDDPPHQRRAYVTQVAF